MNTQKTQTPSITRSRQIEQRVQGRETADGDGVRLTRVLGASLHKRLDPFLMLDAFRNNDPHDYIGGFPDHPHRGFEAITYMIAGRMRHRDSGRHEGLLQNDSVQWMVAGSGLIHSELPEQEDGLMEGFQLWLNLPAQDKMGTPSYRDIPAASIPEWVSADGVKVRVIAGYIHEVPGAVQRPVTEPLYLDVHLPAGTQIDVPIPATHNAFVYAYRGEAAVGDGEAAQPLPDRHMGILTSDDGADGVRLHATQASRVLIVAGKPLHQSIVAYGPFVMNTPEQIEQAFSDYRQGKFEAKTVQAL